MSGLMAVITRRPFFALRPPPEARAALAEQRDTLDVGGRPLRDDLFHITLLLMPDHETLPPGLAARLLAIGDGINAAPFRILFDELVGGSGSMLLRVSEPAAHVSAFQAKLADAALQDGIAVSTGWRFAPHVTLRRGKVMPFREPTEPIGWRVEDFVLLISHVGETRHEEIGRWPLVGAER